MGAGDAGPACWALELGSPSPGRHHISFLYFYPIFISHGQGTEDEIHEQGVQRGILKVYPQTGAQQQGPSCQHPAVGVTSPGLKGHPVRPDPC